MKLLTEIYHEIIFIVLVLLAVMCITQYQVTESLYKELRETIAEQSKEVLYDRFPLKFPGPVYWLDVKSAKLEWIKNHGGGE